MNIVVQEKVNDVWTDVKFITREKSEQIIKKSMEIHNFELTKVINREKTS